jgi:hypothetical protein
MQMFERPYLEPIKEKTFEYLEHSVPRIQRQIYRWFSNQDEFADEGQELDKKD